VPIQGLISSLFNFIVTIEYSTLIVAIILLHKKRIGLWQLFIPLLFLIVCSETLGWYWHTVLKKPNAFIFNFNMIITDSFMIWILSTSEVLRKYKKRLNAIVMAFVIIAMLNLLFYQGYYIYNQYTETIGDLLQIIICCYLFYRLISEDNYRNILAYEYFWLANGILFSSVGSSFLYIFPVILGDYQKHTGINIFGVVNNILNFLLYGSILISFICRNKNTKL
jgi:hypothetical protein